MSNSPRVFTRLDKFIQRKWDELTPRLQSLVDACPQKGPSKQTQEKIVRLRKVLSEAREEVSFLEAKLSCKQAITERKQHLERNIRRASSNYSKWPTTPVFTEKYRNGAIR